MLAKIYGLSVNKKMYMIYIKLYKSPKTQAFDFE